MKTSNATHGTFTFLSAPEGKVKLEQSPPSCLPVNKSQKVTGEILFLVSDFPTNSTTIFSFFRKHPFWINCLKMGTKYLGWALQNFQKSMGNKIWEKDWVIKLFLVGQVEMTWKWRGNDVEMTWKWRGLDHWSTDLQSCKCSWGEIWEIWGTILVQMALIFWQGALHFYIWGVQRTTRFKKSWRQNRNTFTDTFTYKSLDKYFDKYVDKSFYQYVFRNMCLEICI